MAESVIGVNDNMRMGEIKVKETGNDFMNPNAKDSLYDKNEAGVEYVVKGGVGNKDNLGGENTRS